MGVPAVYGPALGWIEMNPSEDEVVDDDVVVVVVPPVVAVGMKSMPRNLGPGAIVVRYPEFEL